MLMLWEKFHAPGWEACLEQHLKLWLVRQRYVSEEAVLDFCVNLALVIQDLPMQNVSFGSCARSYRVLDFEDLFGSRLLDQQQQREPWVLGMRPFRL